MARGGGGRGWGTTRKDYALLRDGFANELEDVESAAGNKKSATVFRLLALAKEEAWVRHSQ